MTRPDAEAKPVKLTRLERDLLESLAGTRTHHEDGSPITWGAWMSVCLESLVRFSYVSNGPSHQITPAGRAALKEAEHG